MEQLLAEWKYFYDELNKKSIEQELNYAHYLAEQTCLMLVEEYESDSIKNR